MRRRDVKSYCRFSKRRLVCPYPEEERTLAFCMVCKVTRLTNQMDLVIRHNKVVIDVIMKIRDSLNGESRANAQNLHTDYFESYVALF